MKKVVFAIIIMLAAGAQWVHAEDSSDQGIDSDSQVIHEEYSFEQASDHCYYLTIEENGENIAIVSTTQGILMFDPPPEPDLTATMEALDVLAWRPVRWIINTGLYASRTEGVDHYAHQGALQLTSYRQQSSKVFEPEPVEEPDPEPAGFGFFNDPDDVFFPPFPGPAETGMEDPERPDDDTPVFPEFIFKNRMYLFPEDVEIQIRALPHPARTDADLFAYVPDEKVLFTGRLFEPGHYPDIDITAGGSALQWIDALEMVIDSVPLLISAIPPEEEEEGEEELTEDEALLDAGLLGEEEEEEKSLEEYITVISARGEPANLMDMKDLLAMAKKLRNDISRAIKAGRTCDSYLDSSATNTYLEYGNFFTYANHLCQELSPEEEPEEEMEGELETVVE